MDSTIFQFTVGKFKCTAVSDGTNIYAPPMFPPPAKMLFLNAPADKLEAALLKHNIQREDWTEWVSPYICLLIDTGETLVLVDTGAFGLSPRVGKLRVNLQGLGISPEDIDLIILTHAHPDHIGGNTLDNGQLAFPNARYAMWKGEWDFWTAEGMEKQLDEHAREVLSAFARKNLPPIQDRLELPEDEKEIIPGIKAISAPGHTPGHMVLFISSADQNFLHLVDSILHPIHVAQPEWFSVFDLVPDQIAATRHRLFEIAAGENALVLAFHFPFPGLGHISQIGKVWQWHPLAPEA